MTKIIQIREVPDDIYWEWSRKKEESDSNNWFEFFEERIND